MACTEVIEPFLVEVMRSCRRAHVGRQRRLIAHRRGDAAQQRRHFGAGLGEAEDVVDEEQHVLAFLVAEIFGDGETRQRHARAGARRLVHLAIDQRHLGVEAARARRRRAAPAGPRMRVRFIILAARVAGTSAVAELVKALEGDEEASTKARASRPRWRRSQPTNGSTRSSGTG